jgi:F0F1-type ATP synthase delta subunit
MPTRLPRRKLAKHSARLIIEGKTEIFDQLAALLVSEHRTQEASLLVRDIEDQLAELGHIVVRVESAKPIDEATRTSIRQLFDGQMVYIEETVRPELIGGIRLSTPTKRLDRTVLKKLNDLRSMSE